MSISDLNKEEFIEDNNSIVLLTKFYQKSKNGKVEGVIENDSIQLAVGVNKFSEKAVKVIEPVKTGAGIFINEGISPSYVFNPNRLEKGAGGLTLNQANSENANKLNNTEKGISTVTLFADHLQLVSWLNGVAIHTSPEATQNQRGLTSLTRGVGVSLIHNNDVENLQPMVLGKNLNDYLTELETSIRNINHNVFALRNSATIIFGILAAHVHITTLPGVPTAPSIETAIGVIASQPTNIKNQIDNVIGCLNGAIREVNFKTKLTDISITSNHHKLN